jgi:hypothetical protein
LVKKVAVVASKLRRQEAPPALPLNNWALGGIFEHALAPKGDSRCSDGPQRPVLLSSKTQWEKAYATRVLDEQGVE